MSPKPGTIWIPTWLGLLIAAGVLWAIVRIYLGDSGGIPDVPSEDGQRYALIGRAQESVRGHLKDPGSAQFRGERVVRTAGMPPVVCGQVNSKNSFGGYGGYQSFISAGTDQLTYMQESAELENFEELWAKLCP